MNAVERHNLEKYKRKEQIDQAIAFAICLAVIVVCVL